MKAPSARKIFFVFLLYFFAFTAFINFFHTDDILDNQGNCPACQFQRSNIALTFVLFIFLIIFNSLRLPDVATTVPVFFVSPCKKLSRAPPPSFS
jgi:hypothetical protein